MVVQQTAKRLATTVVAALIGGGVFLPQTVRGRQPPSPSRHVLQPDHWVPLTATLEVIEPDGAVIQKYTMYRFTDGSTRRDRHDGLQVEITNRALGKHFEWKAGDWIEHPMRRQLFGGRPMLRLFRQSVIPVDPTDPRVARIARRNGVLLTFYDMPSTDPNLSQSVVLCPELNFLEVWIDVSFAGGDRFRQQVTSIVLGEPVVSLRPPADAHLTISTIPAGSGSMPLDRLPKMNR